MVRSKSALVSDSRPFYSRHANAYDALIGDPIEPWAEAVQARLTACGCEKASLLDAGCGTGRHAEWFVSRGHEVELVDASALLLEVASRRCPSSPAHVADICSLDFANRFDGVACRGVLNDMVSDEERQAALDSFARCLVRDGLLFLDVRETRASRARADGTARHATARLDNGEWLEFHSRTRWSGEVLMVAEHYELTHADGSTEAQEYDFVMRPWGHDELAKRLARSGFADVGIHSGVGRRTPDRLFVTARRG